EEYVQQVLVARDLRVEGDADDLGMAGRARAHGRIRRVGGVSAHVTRLHAVHAFHLIVDGLEAPEAAASQRRDLLAGRWCSSFAISHDVYLSRCLSSVAGSPCRTEAVHALSWSLQRRVGSLRSGPARSPQGRL